MDENRWESVPEAFEADLSLQEQLHLAIAKVLRFKAACLEAGVAIRKALPVGARVQYNVGSESWKGTIISPQGAICDHMAGPVSVLPDEGSDIEAEFTTGEVQVDITELTALSAGEWHWGNQAMRAAHAATLAANAAGTEAQLFVDRLLLVGRQIETYLGSYPSGAICQGEVLALDTFGVSLHVRLEGHKYRPGDSSGHIVDIERVRFPRNRFEQAAE